MTLGSLFLTSILALSPIASAQDPDEELDLDDFDDIVFEDDDDKKEEGKDQKKKDSEDKDSEEKKDGAEEEAGAEETEEETLPEFEDDDEVLLFEDEEGEEVDLLGEEEPERTGGDSNALFRETEARLSRLPPDEEMEGWEAYLRKWPETVYRSRIESRMETLMDELYAQSIQQVEDSTDAMREEIGFAQAILLENIDPRTRVQAGFEWGLPTYLNLRVDYEQQVTRKLSVHAGLTRRFSGFNLEFGPRIALVKASRTNTLLTFIPDFRLNLDPFYPAFRPQLAFGKRFGKADIQLQAGADLEFQSVPVAGGGSQFAVPVRIVGGANFFYLVSDRVGVFAEATVYMRYLVPESTFDGGVASFNTATVGLKFFPSQKGRPDSRDIEVNLGGSVPYLRNWWQYHFGSIAGQFNYYL